MTMQNPYGRQRGLSLVELMVAMLLSLLLLYGVVTIFMGNREAFKVQEALARVQETGRYAIQTIVRDLRQAGYQGCDKGSAVLIENILNSAADSGCSGFHPDLFGDPVKGYDAGSGAWSPALDIANKEPMTSHPPLEASDVIEINIAQPLGVTVTQQPSDDSASIHTSPYADLSVDDILLVTDCQKAAIFQVTNLQNNSTNRSTVVHNQTSQACPGNASQALDKNYTGAQVLRLVNRIYYIAAGASGEPALFRIDNAGTAQELAEGVEAMALTFGVDTDGDDVVDGGFKTAANVASWGDVVAVKISLVVRSAEPRVLPANKAFSFNEGALDVSDRRLRKSFSATVALRNLLQ
ncbi:MAG: hypothetical protein D6720_07520 [Gammaproteobacteria bacterium]|nr:MAG: hypothetical protein D6720_07520 [Gammaproteobacteria bacterium]